MTLAAVLFMSTAFGQVVPGTWPSASADVKFQDTIMVCAGENRPVELKYDVKSTGKAWDESLGSWALVGLTDLASEGTYTQDLSDNLINGNIFNTAAAPVGGYIFQFTSLGSAQCNLAVNEKAWAYVFVLPRLDTIMLPAKTVCEGDVAFLGTTVTLTPAYVNTLFSPHAQDVLAKAKITFTPTFTPASWAIETITKTYSAAFSLNTPSFYDCKAAGTLFLPVIVQPKGDTLTHQAHYRCEDQIIFNSATYLQSVGNRQNAGGGTYTPSTITPAHLALGSQIYVYSYTTCDGTPATANDTIHFTNTLPAAADTAFLKICSGLIADGMDLDQITKLSGSAYEWNPNFPVNEPFYHWSNFNTGGPTTDQGDAAHYVGKSASVLLAYINPSKMLQNVPYYFGYKIDNSAICFGGQQGVLKFAKASESKAVDYRVQMCYATPFTPFDLRAYTGLDKSTWTIVTPSNGAVIQSNGVISAADLALLGRSTHKFKYVVNSSCGKDSAMLYLKIGETNFISKDVTVQYCVSALDRAIINVNDLVGIAGGSINNNGTWTLVSNTAALTGTDTNPTSYFDATTGQFGITDYVGAGNVKDVAALGTVTLEFKLTGASCITPASSDITLKVLIKGSLAD